MIRVGTNSFGYNHVRNFAGLPFENVVFRKVYDLNKLRSYIKYKMMRQIDYKLINRFNALAIGNVDLYHFFNTITPINRPWVVTYETTLPRSEPEFIKGYKWLASKNCRKIIALSQRAFSLQAEAIKAVPFYSEEILQKLCILHPSQRMLIENISKKNYAGVIKFIFIGSAFFRKGGYELVRAFEVLKESNIPARLTIVSKLEIEGHKDLNITSATKEETIKLIENNPLIEYHPYLPNQRVLELLRDGHVGVLPSYAETYGYSLLEAMASGCAVISTNLSPFPEFVKEDWGWLVDMPIATKGVSQFINIDDPKEYKILSGLLIEKLVELIKHICNNRASIEQKSKKAVSRILSFHNPTERAKQIEQIYIDAIN